MPAKKRTAASTSKNSDSPLSPHTDDPAYKEKRKKNNEVSLRVLDVNREQRLGNMLLWRRGPQKSPKIDAHY